MKTLEDERYVVIKVYMLTVFEILRNFLYFHNIILHVRAIPTLEYTNSMITLSVLCRLLNHDNATYIPSMANLGSTPNHVLRVQRFS